MKKFKYNKGKSASANKRAAERKGARVGDIIPVNRDTYYKRIDARKTGDAKAAMLKKGTKWEKV